MGYKIKTILFLMITLIVYSGCTIGTNLDKGELKYQINPDNSVIFSGYLLKTDIQLFLPLDLDASNENIIKDITHYYQSLDHSIEVIEYKQKKDYGYFMLEYANPEDLYLKVNNTLSDYATTNYGTFDEMIKWEVFLDYEDMAALTQSELISAQSYSILTVNGSTNGVYYQVPGSINFVSDEMNYKRKASDVIYLEPGHFGIIAYSKE